MTPGITGENSAHRRPRVKPNPDHGKRSTRTGQGIDAGTGEELRRFDLLSIGFAFSPDSRTLAHAGWREKHVHLIELATGEERHSLTGHIGGIERLRFSPDGKLLLSDSYDTTALLWDMTGRQASPAAGRPLTRTELDSLWASLAGNNATKAYDAIRTLAASTSQALPFLAEHLHPVEPVGSQLLARLIADLDGDQFADREKATHDLDKLGDTATRALRKALASQPSPEARRRLETILAKQAEEQRKPSGERLRSIRALEALELIGGRRAREILQDLASGSPEARLTEDAKATLTRLSRRPITDR